MKFSNTEAWILIAILIPQISDYHIQSHHFIDGEIEAWNGEALSSLIP